MTLHLYNILVEVLPPYLMLLTIYNTDLDPTISFS